jgi:NADH:ubiquinone oxidoreductase subunit E
MPSKIRVTVCSGTTCYLMGGSEFLLLEEQLPPELRERVVVEGKPCLEHCRRGAKGKAPFVLIDGELITDATIPSVVELLTRMAKER